VLLAYWPSSRALWDYWIEHPGFGAHGVLVAGLALWLLYRARARVAAAPVRGRPGFVPALLGCALAAAVLWRGGAQSLGLLLLPAVMLLAVLAALGTAVARAIALPLCFLYFSMPVWDILAVPLQNLTVAVARLAVRLLGIPATISGSEVLLPGGNRFEVTVWCSGLGFLVQGLAVAVFLGELEDASRAHRLRLVGGVILVALVANWIRVVAIIEAGYATDMRHVIVTHHLMFGYLVFVAALVVFVWAATRGSLPASGPSTPAVQAAQSAAPGPYAAVILALLAAPVLAALLARARAAPIACTPALSGVSAAWHEQAVAPESPWRPAFTHAREWRAGFRDPAARSIEARIFAFDGPPQPSESLESGNALTGSDQPAAPERRHWLEAAGRSYREDEVADAHGERSLIWSFYGVDGRRFAHPLPAQLWYGMHLLGAPPAAAVLAFRSACSPACAEARAALRDFVGGIGRDDESQGPCSGPR
jgi:exosortase